MNYQLPVLNNQKPLISIELKLGESPSETSSSPEPKQYTIVDGDTLEKIALDQHTTVSRLFSKNTSIIDPNIIETGQTLVIPAADEVLPERAMPQSDLFGQGNKMVGTAVTGGSVFEWGWCVWYADQQRPDIHAQGNAADWIRYANSKVPRVGAVAVNTWAAGGLGHVGIVRDFNDMQVLVESMNFTAGFGKVSTDWVDRGYWAGYIL